MPGQIYARGEFHMSHQQVVFQYKMGIVTDGYSFSAHNNIIILSGYIEKLENAKVRDAIHYEAEHARSLYIDNINKMKTAGEKLNTFLAKREAIKKAKEATKIMYADVWDDMESIKNICKSSIIPSNIPTESNPTKLSDQPHHPIRFIDKKATLLIAVSDPNNNNQWINETMSVTNLKQLLETYNENEIAPCMSTIGEVMNLIMSLHLRQEMKLFVFSL